MTEDLMNTVIRNDNSDTNNDTLIAARALYDKKDYEQSLRLFLNFISSASFDFSVYIDIGNCYFYLDDDKNALEFWQRAIDLNPEKSIPYVNIGNLYYKKNKIDKAISFWVKASTIMPEDTRLNINLAVAFSKKQMAEEAIHFYKKFLKYEKDKDSEDFLKIKDKIEFLMANANKYMELGVELQENKQKQAAVKAYFKALSYYPALPKANSNLGALFFQDNNLPLAIKYWKKAYYLEPQNQNILINLSLAYDMMKEFDYAYCYYKRYADFITTNKEEFEKVGSRMVALKNVLMASPYLVSKHLELAKEALETSDFPKALDEFRNYTILNSQDKDKYVRLIDQIKMYVDPEPHIIQNSFKKGDRAFEKKDYLEAKSFYERILSLASPKLLEYNQAKNKLSSCVRHLGKND